MFTISERSFKLTVMFFELTNSQATFQTILNEILWNLINIRKIASFIDDMIVEIETEEEHNEIVVIYRSTCPKTTSLWWNHLWTIQAHLSRNISHGGSATLQIFRLPWRRYFYSTQSSMTELLLSVSQYWNLRSGQ